MVDTGTEEEAQEAIETEQNLFDELALSLARQALQQLLQNKIDANLQSSLN